MDRTGKRWALVAGAVTATWAVVSVAMQVPPTTGIANLIGWIDVIRPSWLTHSVINGAVAVFVSCVTTGLVVRWRVARTGLKPTIAQGSETDTAPAAPRPEADLRRAEGVISATEALLESPGGNLSAYMDRVFQARQGLARYRGITMAKPERLPEPTGQLSSRLLRPIQMPEYPGKESVTRTTPELRLASPVPVTGRDRHGNATQPNLPRHHVCISCSEPFLVAPIGDAPVSEYSSVNCEHCGKINLVSNR